MLTLKKPKKLNKGDVVATVSLSWGGAGESDILWRYQQGKERLENVFGVKVVEMPNTLKGADYIYAHPEKRAEDLMQAFSDPNIKGIITCIGGIESVRMLPYIDIDVIKNNPKVFMGYSDTTTTHLMCLKAGISSIYGPTLLVDFAENISMTPYTIEGVNKALFNTESIGKIEPANEWTSQFLPWEIRNKHTARVFKPREEGHELVQGKGTVTGHLIGGCFEVFDSLRGTSIFPSDDILEGAILFFETSQDTPPPWFVECALRNYGIVGILDKIKGMIWGKPLDEVYYDEYKDAIRKVMAEFGCSEKPVLYNLNFGHTEPKFCLPYGAMAEINSEEKSLTIVESGVI